ncbi:uncharacterized protein [Rutidosis leptorrhynchoides]|uniref:uncharacterized protein n=1 Tax=Rutidosis leptorrhynchoides TaxID=125765 RepID=UPI003A98F5E8
MDKLRFVHQWIPDEQSKVQRFVEILRPEYRTIARLATTFSQAHMLAKITESDLKAARSMKTESVSQVKPAASQSSQQSKKSSRFKPKGQFCQGGSVSSGQKTWCRTCKSLHSGQCTTLTKRCLRCGIVGHEPQDCSFKNNVCWNCHKEGHRYAEYPTARKSYSGAGSGSGKHKNPPPHEARAFQMSVDAATATDDAITGMFLVNSVMARVLFDCGANCSSVSTAFCAKLNVPVRVINEPLSVKVGDGRTIPVINVRHNWLSDHKADIKCDRKVIYFPVAGGKRVIARGDRGEFRCPLLSMMKAQKSLAKGCDSFLAYVIDVKKEKKVVFDIHVVSEYPEVFPDELPGLPPIREVEYKTELVPGATPVAKDPYRLAPSEIREMMACKLFLDKFVIVFIDDILMYFKTESEHAEHLRQWGNEQKTAFQTLKSLLCQAPVLALPEGSDEFVVYCDASLSALGCVLMQRDRRHYLYGTHCVICTDHKSLQYIFSQKEMNMRQRWWQESLKDYDLDRLKITQLEALHDEHLKSELMVKRRVELMNDSRGLKTYHERVWVSLLGGLRDLILNEAHKSRLSMHLGSTKMYHV